MFTNIHKIRLFAAFIMCLLIIWQLILNKKSLLFTILLCSVFLLIILYIYWKKSNVLISFNEENEIEGYIVFSNKKSFIVSTSEYGNVYFLKNSNFLDEKLINNSYVKVKILKNSTKDINFSDFQLINKINFFVSECNIIKYQPCIYSIKNEIDNWVCSQNFIFFKKYFLLLVFSQDNDFPNIKTIAKDLNILHLIAISGLHFLIIFNLLKKFLFFIRNENFKNNIVLWLMFCYLIFIPNFISALRSYIMILLKNKTKKYNLKTNMLDSFSISAFIIFCFNPYYLLNHSYIFSFLISLFILLFSPILKAKITKKLIMNFILLLFVYLFNVPLSVHISNQFNFFSLFWIIIFTPIFEFLFCLSILLFCFPNFLNSMYFLLDKLLYFANKNSFIIFNLSISFSLLLLYYLIVIIFLLFFNIKNNSKNIKKIVIY